MELRESIEEINQKLVDNYHRDISDGRPNYRVVWSDDQFEKRVMTHDDHGNEFIMPEVRLVPKYRQWIRHRYVLERLMPIIGETDLLEKVAYEPAWTFEDKHGRYLPPWYTACEFVIENILMNRGVRNYYTKYKDTMSKEEYIANVQKMEDELFGNETEVGDHLAYGTGVVVPENKTLS